MFLGCNFVFNRLLNFAIHAVQSHMEARWGQHQSYTNYLSRFCTKSQTKCLHPFIDLENLAAHYTVSFIHKKQWPRLQFQRTWMHTAHCHFPDVLQRTPQKNPLISNRFIIFCTSFTVDFKEVHGDGVSGPWDFVEDSAVEINVHGGDREDATSNGSRLWNVCLVLGLCKLWCVIIDVQDSHINLSKTQDHKYYEPSKNILSIKECVYYSKMKAILVNSYVLCAQKANNVLFSLPQKTALWQLQLVRSICEHSIFFSSI